VAADSDRALETNGFDIVHDIPMLSFVARARIEHRDA